MVNKKNSSIFLLVIWIVFIFIMSSLAGDESNAKSYFVVDILKAIGMNNFSGAEDILNFIVRKSGHFLEYLILSILVYNFLRRNTQFKHVYVITIILVFGYACTDEIHQLFVPGRDGKFSDVMIDTLGGSTGIFILSIFNKFKRDTKIVKKT